MNEYFYELDLSSKSVNTCQISFQGYEKLEITTNTQTPADNKRKWTPDHLLAAAIASSYMTAFLETANEFGLEVLNYQSHCFIKLEKKNEHYITTEILLRPTILIKNSKESIKANKCLEIAEQNSSMKNVFKIHINVHPQFQMAE
jgi:organic hydroperoxide reductase OsmC/OhrA